MIELKQAERGLFSRGYGGDTLNTAVYLARLGVAADYITALGDDTLSDEMIAGWAAEGVGTRRVMRLPGKLPGIYMIQTDDKGERRFFHWRESAAARSLMDLPETRTSWIRSRVTTSSISRRSRCRSTVTSGRARLFAGIKRAREAGARFAFDTNFRARGWPDLNVARAVYQRGFRACRYRAGLDRGFAAALSRRKQRKPAGADSGRGGRAEAFRTREHRSSRWRLASDQGRSP